MRLGKNCGEFSINYPRFYPNKINYNIGNDMKNNVKNQKNKLHASLLSMLPAEEVNRLQQGLYSGEPLLGKKGLLNNLIKELLELSLQGEMDAHLSENSLEEGNNRRNGFNQKQVKTASGSIELNTPRDRNGSFEPELIKKRQTVLNEELDNKILSLYALGNSYNSIADHIQDIYGMEISNAKISAITDRLIPELNEWRNRPLDRQYAIIFLDAMFFKSKQDNKIENAKSKLNKTY